MVRLEIASVEKTIENEIRLGLDRKDIAKTYAMALRSSWPTDWAKVNQMIIERWSLSGLEYIKNLAHSGECFEAESEE